MREIDYKRTILHNGLRVITVRRDTDIFSMAAGIKSGSLYEDINNNGISHMVEHMLFKGTLKRDMECISTDLEKLAGELDIYTTYRQTILEISVMKEKSGDCMEVISDMLMNPTFPKRELSLEKKVIIEEIKMEKDDPEDVSYLGLYKAACPAIWHKFNITGTIKSVRSIKGIELMEYYSERYTPDNTVICMVSSYSHEEMVLLAGKYFGVWEERRIAPKAVIERVITPGRVVSSRKGIGQAHILYGFDIQGLSRREEIALALLNRKIGSGSSSMLFKELRDNKGYAYNVYSDMDLVEGLRMFYIYAAVSTENTSDTINIIDGIISRFAGGEKLIDDEWTARMRSIFVTDTSIAMESAVHTADYLLDGELNYSNPIEYRNVLSIMEDIGSDDIAAVGVRVLKDPIVHILTPGRA